MHAAALLSAALGLATWALHTRLPPGIGFGSLGASLAATFGSPAFWRLVVVFTVLLAALWVTACRALGSRWNRAPQAVRDASVPLLWGAALPLATPLVDSFSFWCAGAPLAALGIGCGALQAVRKCSALVPRGELVAAVPWRLVVAALAVVVPLSLLITGWSPPSGDEPHYLLVAHSMVTDGDIDVTDEYEDAEYAPFHPALLYPHTKRGVAEGSHYSMHGLGLSVALVPAYAVGRMIGAEAAVALPRAFVILLFGAFAWVLYGFVEDNAGARAAAAGTAATVLLAPLLFSPLYLFSEVPAMLLALVGFRGVGKPGRGSPWAATALAALPWIGVKYIPLAAMIVVCGIVRDGRQGLVRRAGPVAAPLAISLLLHGGYTWLLYGSVSPAAIYLGAGPQTGAPALGGSWGAYVAAWPRALATAVGYLLDQKEGLLMYGPHFLLTIGGLASMWKQRRFESVALGLVVAAYIGPYALSQQLSGQGPPVRPLMAILWALAPALGLGLVAAGTRLYAALRGGLLALSAGLTLAYASQPYLLPHDYPVDASRLLTAYSPRDSGWWRLFPQWVEIEVPNWPATFLWTAVVLALAAYFWRRGEGRAGDGTTAEAADGGSLRVGARAAAVGWITLCGLVLVHHALVVTTDRHRRTEMANGMVAWVPRELPEVGWAEAGGVWATPGRQFDFVITTQTPLETLDVSLRVLVEADVAAWVQGYGMSGTAAPGSNRVARLAVGAGRRYGSGYAYHCRLYASAGAAPADLEGGEDRRVLGVFFQLVGPAP